MTLGTARKTPYELYISMGLGYMDTDIELLCIYKAMLRLYMQNPPWSMYHHPNKIQSFYKALDTNLYIYTYDYKRADT